MMKGFGPGSLNTRCSKDGGAGIESGRGLGYGGVWQQVLLCPCSMGCPCIITQQGWSGIMGNNPLVLPGFCETEQVQLFVRNEFVREELLLLRDPTWNRAILSNDYTLQ